MTRLFAIATAIALCVGCKTYVPVESVKTVYKTRDSIQYDSIYIKDSVFVRNISDTVYLYKYRDQYTYKYIDRIDTVMVCDSIQVPYPIQSELSWWQKARMRAGEVAMGVVAILILLFVVKKIYSNSPV